MDVPTVFNYNLPSGIKTTESNVELPLASEIWLKLGKSVIKGLPSATYRGKLLKDPPFIFIEEE